MVPRWFGPSLGKATNFPIPIDLQDDVVKQMAEIEYPKLCKTVKIQSKKYTILNFPIGTVSLTPVQLVFVFFNDLCVENRQ